MKIGVGLPAAIPDVPSNLVLKWAARAEELGFSSLGLIDRVVYDNYEPLVTLAAAAAVTRRVKLMTTILLAPTREPAILAKQAATIDCLSNGRLTLGLGIGSREDDFEASGQNFRTRGGRFEKELEIMKSIWSRNNTVPYDIGPVPVRNGGPEILIGGYDPRAISRIGKYADGYISGSGGDPHKIVEIHKLVQESWRKNSRTGEPVMVVCLYFALGERAVERAAPFLRGYYSQYGEYLLNAMRKPNALSDSIRAFENTGIVSELMLWPSIPDGEQLELLSRLLEHRNW
jgi:alkanesulfonate monooxygenase SsuD/methylene tetrahydromethanopterin reductase-like flavin-dependent oxidoreductase (luciferase family)